MSNKNKKKRWVRYRHRVVRNILSVTLGVYTRLKYHIKVERFKEQQKRPYLILFNHQTAFDQFFVGMSFKGPVYYVASEDLFSNGFVSSLIRFLAAPIPIKKQTTDLRAIMNCIRVVGEGGTVAIAPEGNRTYGGRTCYMSPAVASLAKKLKVPVALFRIEGGYYVHPRWSDKVRKGRMRAYVSEVIMPEEYADMTDAELFSRIEQGLALDEGGKAPMPIKGKHLAEHLERAMYYCPACGISSFASKGNTVTCCRCGWSVTLTAEHTLLTPQGYGEIDTIGKWYDRQTSFVLDMDPLNMADEPLGTDSSVRLLRVIPYKKKELISKSATVTLYPTRLTVKYGGGELDVPFNRADSLAVLGRNKVNIYLDGNIYQLKGQPSYCGLKAVNMFCNYKNKKAGNNNEFLGL